MKSYQIHPSIIARFETNKLLLTSVDPTEDFIYEFQGASVEVLKVLLEKKVFDLSDLKTDEASAQKLIDFGLEHGIFLLKA